MTLKNRDEILKRGLRNGHTPQVEDFVELKTVAVPTMSHSMFELIDSRELARRLNVPETWVRSRSRARTPVDQRIPCVRFGRYVRYEWGSPRLVEWLARQRA
jgi:hypothetical protein